MFFLNFYIYYIKFFDKNQKSGARTGKTVAKRLITVRFCIERCKFPAISRDIHLFIVIFDAKVSRNTEIDYIAVRIVAVYL